MSTPTPDEPGQPARPRRWRRVALPSVGILAVAGGVALLVGGAANQASFGWTAYAPLSSTVFVLDAGAGPRGWGLGLLAVGIAVLAFWAGLLVGRRAR